MNAQAGDELEALLARVDAGDLGDPLPVLAYLAGQAVSFDDGELNGARRRALLLVAAGGDPHRPLEVDDRAVKSLAADLYNADRRDAAGAEPGRARPAGARPARRAGGGALPRHRRRSRLAAVLARPARRGARRMTPAVQAAKRAGIEFRLHEYEGVELGDGDYALGGRRALGKPRGPVVQDARRLGRRRPAGVRPPGRPATRSARASASARRWPIAPMPSARPATSSVASARSASAAAADGRRRFGARVGDDPGQRRPPRPADRAHAAGSRGADRRERRPRSS